MQSLFFRYSISDDLEKCTKSNSSCIQRSLKKTDKNNKITEEDQKRVDACKGLVDFGKEVQESEEFGRLAGSLGGIISGIFG